MQSPGLHSNSVSLHDSDPFDSNRFIIFHSTTIRNMPRTNKPNKPKFTKDLSVTQIYYIIYRDIKLKLEQSCFSYCEFLGKISFFHNFFFIFILSFFKGNYFVSFLFYIFFNFSFKLMKFLFN